MINVIAYITGYEIIEQNIFFKPAVWKSFFMKSETTLFLKVTPKKYRSNK